MMRWRDLPEAWREEWRQAVIEMNVAKVRHLLARHEAQESKARYLAARKLRRTDKT